MKDHNDVSYVVYKPFTAALVMKLLSDSREERHRRDTYSGLSGV